jgi:hypothetical protein
MGGESTVIRTVDSTFSGHAPLWIHPHFSSISATRETLLQLTHLSVFAMIVICDCNGS